MQRQEWYREYAENAGYGALDFVGSVKLSDAPSAVAAAMQSRLRFGINERRAASGIDDTIRIFIESAERIGVLVMVSGIVGSNTQRVLDCDEFQGFALTDRVAPLVFVNGADWKAAQVFTLAHELAHVWLGSSALSNATPDRIQNEAIEIWCNAVAAELLVPTAELRAAMVTANPINEVPNLSYAFRVSTLVILRRLKDTGLITTEQFWRAYKSETESFQSQSRAKGGNYYQTQPYRVSRTFARAIIASASEGSTLYRDAFRLLGVKKDATFRELGKKLKVLP
jgi:Zn-dependent peptidase ImmA (M78 family)